MATRELIVTVDGRERTVVVDGPTDDGGFRVTIDGVARDVDARAVRPGTWSLVIGPPPASLSDAARPGEAGPFAGASFVVDLDARRGGAIAASVGASEAMLVVEDARQRRLAQAAHAHRPVQRGETIRAPIAGKVVKVVVAVGEVVAAGKPVVVLEAMKMENELIAERGGTVDKVLKQAGQAVDTGDALIELI